MREAVGELIWSPSLSKATFLHGEQGEVLVAGL